MFYVNMDLTQKALFVVGGSRTDPPTSMTYASFVISDSLGLVFLLAAANGLQILVGDIAKTYLNAPTQEH